MVSLSREYALMRGCIVDWKEFQNNNPWAIKYNLPSFNVPSECIAVYYVVDVEQKVLKDVLRMVTWNSKYQADFKSLSLTWVQEHFEVETSDLLQVNKPEETIIQPGGEIFSLLNQEEIVVGVVATVIHKGVCELAKMSIRKEYTGKGYANVLMREAIQWAKDKKYSYIELLSSLKLQNAIEIYKKYGFVTTHLGSHPDYNRCDIIMRLALS